LKAWFGGCKDNLVQIRVHGNLPQFSYIDRVESGNAIQTQLTRTPPEPSTPQIDYKPPSGMLFRF